MTQATFTATQKFTASSLNDARLARRERQAAVASRTARLRPQLSSPVFQAQFYAETSGHAFNDHHAWTVPTPLLPPGHPGRRIVRCRLGLLGLSSPHDFHRWAQAGILTHADEHGLRIPTLRRFVEVGAYADGVLGSLPTVTYPNHTTLITGVWPSEHGILNTQLFDPEHKLAGAWYWYAESIKVPTLWDAAHQAGIATASVSWPVRVDAISVDILIPEYWRTSSPGDGANTQDRYLMNAISRPEGALAAMEARLGPYMMGNDTSVEGGDAVRSAPGSRLTFSATEGRAL
jgi:hypothetical protein